MAEGGGPEDLQTLREQVAQLTAEKEEWLEKEERLTEEVETLRSRCQKLARAASRADPPKSDAGCQTEGSVADVEGAGAPRGGGAEESEASGKLPPVIEQMLRSPKDDAIQLKGIETLFAQQTQVDGAQNGTNAPALQASLEVAVAVFQNHAGNRPLLLKACQLLSVLLAEADAQQRLPLTVLWQAAQAVVAVSRQLLVEVAAAGPTSEAAPAGKAGATPSPAKLLTWFLSPLALLLPCLGGQLKVQAQSEPFVRDMLANLVAKLLSSGELAQQEVLLRKCVELIPLLPMEPWVQNACLESHAIHSLALAYQRWRRSAGEKSVTESPLPKAIHAALRGVFADNLELCVKAVTDTFVSDEFVCLEVLEQLKSMEKRRRGTFRDLDRDHGIIGKAVGLWTFHQRAVLEAPEPQQSPSREVLQKVAALLSAVIVKLAPAVLLQRMKEYETVEIVQRVALAAVHHNPQLRLQMSVNYSENGVVPVIIGCMQMCLQAYEGSPGAPSPSAALEASLRLLGDEQLPSEGWPYIAYCLEVCVHILSHWSATKLSLQKADTLDASAAPLQLAQSGLVDALAEILDPQAAGIDMRERPPTAVVQQATDTLQALFEQNGHICLFCMQHYSEVKQMVLLGCDSLSMDPLTDFPDMQQQAVSQLAAAFEKYAVSDERLGRRILKALTAMFESSYKLVAWFLENHALSTLGEYQSLDVHVEAIRAVSRTPYWSAEDAAILLDFVAILASFLLDGIQGLGPDDHAPPPSMKRRVLDLTEAEELVAACMSSVLHLLLIDPRPPMGLKSLAASLAKHGQDSLSDKPAQDEEKDYSEEAVSTVMKVMQVFPSSDRTQGSCQHLLNALLGD